MSFCLRAASTLAAAAGRCLVLLLGLGLVPVQDVLAAQDFSPAERALFMDAQLEGLEPPLALRYDWHKEGTLEPGFDDQVALTLKAQGDGRCCAVSANFFTGERAVPQPEVDAAQGNPAILYFLERDIREMQRLTRGQANYFRKRIRLAVFQAATLRELKLPYQGREVPVQEIRITPYADDPLRARYPRLSGKVYLFQLSEAVPGRLYAIRTRIDSPTPGAPPLLVEEMRIEGGR